ncbi:glycosyltransferase family 92 protein [Rhodobacterales bacterium HKCCSP123]|nr:glycosyltransferase family 92 protein [Rhodobacterales bacterium HKCCSP123]
MNLVLVTSLKNEGPYVIEWLAYHKSIGFDDVVIFENDSDDFTDLILKRLEAMGEIGFVKNHSYENNPQAHSYRIFRGMEAYRTADWVFCIDGDEFFVPKQHDRVTDFLNDYHDADAIAVNWLNFGSAGQEAWVDEMVTRRFRRCAPFVHQANRFFKCFHRPGTLFRTFGIHRPWPKAPVETFVYPDGTMVEHEAQMGRAPAISEELAQRHQLCSLNHYSLKSRQEFDLKKRRGRGARPDVPYGKGDKFGKGDTNTETNHDIDRFLDRTTALMEVYLSDPVLAFLHHSSLARHFGPRA